MPNCHPTLMAGQRGVLDATVRATHPPYEPRRHRTGTGIPARRSGDCATIEAIKLQLRREGYSTSQIEDKALKAQLTGLIREARPAK